MHKKAPRTTRRSFGACESADTGRLSLSVGVKRRCRARVEANSTRHSLQRPGLLHAFAAQSCKSTRGKVATPCSHQSRTCIVVLTDGSLSRVPVTCFGAAAAVMRWRPSEKARKTQNGAETPKPWP